MECCVGTPEVHHRPLGQQQRDCLHGVLHVICWRARIQKQACQGSPATWWLTVAAWEEGVVKMTQGLTVSKGFFLFQRVRSVYFRDWVTKLENNIENTGDDS